MSQPEQRLALAIIGAHFGDVPHKICSLLTGGRLSFIQLGRAAHLRVSQLQSGLVALVQHHLVRVVPLSEADATLVYELDVASVLLRIRIPRYLAYIGDRFGELNEQVVHDILLHGRMRLSNLHQALRTAHPTLTMETLFGKFEELVREHIIARVGGPANSDYAISAACRALVSGSKRPRVEEEGSRKKVRLDAGPASADKGDGPPQDREYWRVNLRQINRCLRNEWIISLFEKKIDPTAGRIVRALLANTVNNPAASMTVHDLRRILTDLSDSAVQSYLSVLASDQTAIVVKTGDEHMISFSQTAIMARRLAIEQYVSDRFGAPHARLFRVVNTFGHMEREQVARIAMVATFKETKAMLNQLFRAGLVTVREVPKQTDRTPSRCHYIWSANRDVAIAELLRTTYTSMANLCSRHHQDSTTHSRLMSKSHHLDKGGSGEPTEDYRSNAEKQLAAKVSAGLDKLERAMMQMDQLVLMLRDFDD